MTAEEAAKELARWDNEYTPDAGQRPGVNSLPVGDYEMEVVYAGFDRTPQSRDLILRAHLRVLAGAAVGMIVEHTYFFDTQKKVDRLGADLCALGFDADQWTAKHRRKFSAELLKALPRLRGVRFRARRTADPGKDGKVWHNLHVNGRLTAPTTNGPTAAAAAPYVPPQPPREREHEPEVQEASFRPASEPNDDDIPF